MADAETKPQRQPTEGARKAAQEARARKVDARLGRLEGTLRAAAAEHVGEAAHAARPSHKQMAEAAGLPLSTYWRLLKKVPELASLADAITGHSPALQTPQSGSQEEPRAGNSPDRARYGLEEYARQLATVIVELEEARMTEQTLRGELSSRKQLLAASEKRAADYLADVKRAVALLRQNGLEIIPDLARYEDGNGRPTDTKRQLRLVRE